MKLPFTKKKNTWLEPTVLLAGITTFIALSLGNMSRWSVWFDEAFSYHIIKYSFTDIWRLTAVDVHPPMYYWLLKLWALVFGDGELGLRSFSMACMVGAIIVMYLLVRKLFGLKAALWTVPFMVVAPMLVRYSEEMRMYTLAALIVAGATYALVRAVEKPSWGRWIVYGVLVSLGMWTHYFTAIVWISHWLWAFITLPKWNLKELKTRFLNKYWLGAFGLAVVLYLPWLSAFAAQLESVQTSFWIPPIQANTVLNYISNMLFYREQHEINGWLMVWLYAAIIGAIYVMIYARKQFRDASKDWYDLLLVTSIAPPILLMILSLPPLQPTFIERYLVPSLLFGSVTLGVATAAMLGKRRVIAIGTSLLVISAMIAGTVHVYTIGNFNKNTGYNNVARNLVELVREQPDSDIILTDTPWRYYEASFYDTEGSKLYFISDETIPYGSYQMLRESTSPQKVLDAGAFAAENAPFWYIGEWKPGEMRLRAGNWVVKNEIVLQNDFRAALIDTN